MDLVEVATMRLPDWAYVRLERTYLAQRAVRRRELRKRVEDEDRAFRAACARDEAAHDSGMCGGAAAGCRYFPCYSVR
jgi:predicted alpha/beta-hydrolase family hydrolase